jgi:cyclopropane fatty-acyl-phospholipid synthase-like methyltransferase
MGNIGNLLKRIFFFTSYLRKPRWDTGISPPELMEYLKNHPPGRALDLGCGTGTNVITLSQHGWDVTGVDFISKAVRMAREKIKQARVTARVLQGDVTRLENVTGLYNLILDIGCYHSLSDQEKRMYEANIHHRLASEGSLLLYGFLKTPDYESGISEDDVSHFDALLELHHRQVSQDAQRISAWFEFQKMSK